MKNTYSYNIETNILKVPKCWRKIKNGVKVYFYRTEKHGDDYADYPVATTDRQKNGELGWFGKEFKILGVAIKRRKWWGGAYWELLVNKEE